MKAPIADAALRASVTLLVADILGSGLTAEEVAETLRHPNIADSLVDSALRQSVRGLITVDLLDDLVKNGSITALVVKGRKVYSPAA